MRSILLAGCLAVSTSLAGCAGLSQRDTRIIGGAALGGAAGHVIGGLIGNEVDRRDREKSRYRR